MKYYFYVLRPPKKNHPLKIGITNSPERRIFEHRRHCNIDFKLFRKRSFPNKKRAQKFEQKVIKNLATNGYERVCNEFFFIEPYDLDNVLKKMCQPYAFYTLRSGRKNYTLKAGLTTNPIWKTRSLRRKDNLNYKLFRQKWFPDVVEASEFQQTFFTYLDLLGYEKTEDNELFSVPSQELDEALRNCAFYLK